jgi:hypothetical protein
MYFNHQAGRRGRFPRVRDHMSKEATVFVPDEPTRRERSIAPAPADPNATPMQLLAIMTQRGVSTSDLKDLVSLAKDWEANQARKAYVEAMAAFKAEPIEILKTKDVNIPGGAKFKHAVLADVVDGVVAKLSKHGLSHNWIVTTGDIITVKCVVTHKLGHSESTEMAAPADTGPGRNRIQAVGSTTTYLQRYTLMSLLGLAAKDMDDDGKGAGAQQAPEPPDGYDSWSMDMDAKAEDGKAAHLAAWKGSPQNFRNYATRHDSDWWERSKNKAAKAGA